MGMCTALMDEVNDQLFGAQDYSEPATWYLGLCTSVAANGTITGEHSGDSYARVEITNNTTNWNTSSGGATSNKVDFTFPEASGSGWGALDTWFLSSSSSGGTALIWGTMTEVTPASGQTPVFPAGDLDITMVDNDA